MLYLLISRNIFFKKHRAIKWLPKCEIFVEVVINFAFRSLGEGLYKQINQVSYRVAGLLLKKDLPFAFVIY